MKAMTSRNWEMKIALSEQGMTLRALSQKTGIPAPFLSMICTGRMNPSQEEKDKIATALGMDTSDLFKACNPACPA